MKNITVHHLALAGLFGALILLLTMWPSIRIGRGYIHLGDTFVYLAAVVLPMPYSIMAAATGAALADLLLGGAVWAPASVIIKGLSVLFFCYRPEKPLCLRNFIAPIFGAVLCIGGYYLYEAVIYGNYTVPLAGIPGNILQTMSSGILYILVLSAIRNRIYKSAVK